MKAIVDGKEYTLHNPKVKALTVGEPWFEIGDNVNGQAEFTVYPSHPYYQYVKKLTTDIVILNDGEPEFYGRVLHDDEDFSGTKKVFVEGELAFFCDSVQRPKVYHDTPVSQYLQDIIDNHNSQVEERKQFTLGRVTVTDSNDSLYRYSNWEDTRTILKDKLTDRLGGHLVIRHEDGLRILDYLSDDDYYKQSKQTIEFGKNLLDYSKTMDATDIVTCLIPLGAKLDEEEQDESLQEQRLTISSVNGGVDYVTDDNAVREYGKIHKTEIWDDVTVPENLMNKAKEYLKSVQYEKLVLECNAVDLSLMNTDVDELAVGSSVHCISIPNGLDSWFPVTKKKVYLTQFSKNTITLGSETDNATYTSSNRQETANMEKTINSLPTKKEILQEALQNAQDLINAQTSSGIAIHEPNEFIVADNEDYKNQAKNLWRWGLGGLAHYSDGYDGSVDGVALTMDGKINGNMLLANSVVAESIDISYRKSVETTIEESETAAKEYADEKIRVTRQDIESSIENVEDRVSLAVSSTKEIASRRNYVTDGEQETLSKASFTVSGSAATVEEAEFLNLNCLKISFARTGGIEIQQDLGTLEAGNYAIAVETAYPEDTAKRPSYIGYGFSGNRSTEYYSSHIPDEFFSVSKTVNITKASKTISIYVYGYAGDVAYITNIRCLRDIQELLDDLNARFDVEIGKITASVSDVYENTQHNFCVDGSFAGSDPFSSDWYRSNTTYVSKVTYSSKTSAKMQNESTTNRYIRQTYKISKTGKFRVRLKIACDSASSGKARARVSFNSTSKYTYVGDLTTSWKEFEFEFNVTSTGTKYLYVYNYTGSTTIYVTDIEVLGNVSGYAQSQIEVLSDSITDKVSVGDFSSYLKQYYNSVIVAFNNSSKYVQISAGKIEIYDYGVTTSKKRASFDQNGNHFWRDGYEVGWIGTNYYSGDSSKRGLSFDLEYEGAYMTFSAKKTANASTYSMFWTYALKTVGSYTAGKLHAGCDIDMHGWKLINPSFEDGGITQTIRYVQVLQMNSDGTVQSWGSNGMMRFKNGILVDLTYYA